MAKGTPHSALPLHTIAHYLLDYIITTTSYKNFMQEKSEITPLLATKAPKFIKYETLPKIPYMALSV